MAVFVTDMDQDSDNDVLSASWFDGKIAWYENLSPIGFSDQNSAKIPNDFQLFQNYPNPFNPTTVISWQLAVGSPVKLTVYNPAGEKVALLVDEKQSAGTHSIGFNASSLASGIYYYQLKAGDYREVKKMILMK